VLRPLPLEQDRPDVREVSPHVLELVALIHRRGYRHVMPALRKRLTRLEHRTRHATQLLVQRAGRMKDA
jgi:hypothetical protein